jgi:hypothetical protein
MAETKTARKRAKPKKRATSRTKPKTNSKSKTNSRSGTNSKPKANPGKTRSASSSRKPKGLVDKTKAVGESVEETAKDASRSVGRAAGKAKVPLMAGGAALAAAAGGAALGARQAHRKSGLAKVSSKDLARAARKAGDVGAQVGEIALEVRRARETNGNGHHRSPVEVVLQGLTSRGPRG